MNNKVITKRYFMSTWTFRSSEVTPPCALAIRAIFYQDLELFSKQSVVDRLIDDIAFMFEVQRSDLNVVGFWTPFPYHITLTCWQRLQGPKVL